MLAVVFAGVVSMFLMSSTVVVYGSVDLPEYDSGWRTINQNQTLLLVHNLGTTDLLVYVMGRDETYGIHQIFFGGTGWTDHTEYYGINWYYLTDVSITVYRGETDPYWESVRVMIWEIKAKAGAVGGFALPIDINFQPLVPWVALVSTVIVAVSASLAYLKHRKNQ